MWGRVHAHRGQCSSLSSGEATRHMKLSWFLTHPSKIQVTEFLSTYLLPTSGSVNSLKTFLYVHGCIFVFVWFSPILKFLHTASLFPGYEIGFYPQVTLFGAVLLSNVDVYFSFLMYLRAVCEPPR